MVRYASLLDGVMFLSAVIVACITWTLTKEEIFKELRLHCKNKCETRVAWWHRKLYYLPTCEYCSSHYITLGVLWAVGYQGWDFVLVFFPVVGLANVIMTLYGILRQVLKWVGKQAI